MDWIPYQQRRSAGYAVTTEDPKTQRIETRIEVLGLGDLVLSLEDNGEPVTVDSPVKARLEYK